MTIQKSKKELARAYLERRQHERRAEDRSPLHGIAQIQQALDWQQAERRSANRRGK